MSAERLHVIALISGGKDSFYSLLHCIHHGHSIVALANLLPPAGHGDSPPAVQAIDPAQQQRASAGTDGDCSGGPPSPKRDLNSFMYQTVGHQVVPLYAAATGIPLYRQPILGGPVRCERDYGDDGDAAVDAVVGAQDPAGPADETESMMPLLQAIKARHPEANALCSGAILSNYQRTRVESVALRQGLVPLSYLWKYPVLPGPPGHAQLLRDMAAAGLEARIVKVASAGLDESHLWERVTSDAGADRVERALRRFGSAPGAALGEGGEFETIVLDGPARLFKKRLVVPKSGRAVVPEGGGSSWLLLRGARLDDKPAQAEANLNVREPALLDAKFQSILEAVASTAHDEHVASVLAIPGEASLVGTSALVPVDGRELLQWSVLADADVAGRSIEEEALHVVDKIRKLLASLSRDPCHITNTVIILRDMTDFARVNAEYGKLFGKPNPPSRITISCGNLLPAGRKIVVHMMMPNTQARSDREGLHVQGRSYWAPANIGPYSQAIGIPVTARHEATGLRAVYVAGQIPLVPASMSLPPPSNRPLQEQIVLSLQHLWRIGSEMKVQYWTSAAAYFSRSSSAGEMEQRAKLAGRAWRLIHSPAEDDEEAESGPDPWDLKYNPQYMSLGRNDAHGTRTALPDWSIFMLRQQTEPEACIPPLFAVEVESLPRQSDVEWHAHLGLGHVDESSAETMYLSEVGPRGWRCWQTTFRTADALLVHTVLACGFAGESARGSFGKVKQAMADAYRGALGRLQVDVGASASRDPYLGYVDAARVEDPWQEIEESKGQLSLALVPCHSIRSLQGERLECVALYQTALAVHGRSE